MLRLTRQDLCIHLIRSRLGEKDWLSYFYGFRQIIMYDFKDYEKKQGEAKSREVESKPKAETASTNEKSEPKKVSETPPPNTSMVQLEKKLDDLNETLVFFKRFIVLITITLFAMLSWTALTATGSWWKWFAFLF